MKSKLLHKIIAVWCVFITLLPMGVQFAHALENHEYDLLCELKNIQHCHKKQVQCESNHFVFNLSATINSSFSVVKTTKYFITTPRFYSVNLKGVESYSTPSRAPPNIII